MDLTTIDTQLTEWLRKESLGFTKSEQGNFSIFFTGKIGFRVVFNSFSEDGFNIVASTGRHVPEESIDQACRFACQINYKRSISTIEVDPCDGEWRIRLYVSLMEHKRVPTSVVSEYVGCVHREITKLHEAFESGIFLDTDATEEAEEDDEFQDDELRRILEGEG